MQLDTATLETCAAATQSVVVIDVWRSFTTAAYAFHAGAREILVAASVQQALALRQRMPGSLLVGLGTLGGEPAAGFDYGNSPGELRALDLSGRSVILCTPNGTPGLARCIHASTLLAGSLVCASASVRYLERQAPGRVTFVCTEPGIADQACEEILRARLRGQTPDAAGLLDKIRAAWLEKANSLSAQGALTQAQRERLEIDLNCCIELDQFDFALLVERRDGQLRMTAVPEPGA